MKVIIQKDSRDLGKAGQIIDVADGYAMNELIPKGRVLPASQGNEKIVAENLRQAAKKRELIKQKSIQSAQKIKRQTFIIKVKAGDKGKIFGHITPLQIAKVMQDTIPSLELTHDQITVKEPIESVGIHTVVLQLHPEVVTEIQVEVKSS